MLSFEGEPIMKSRRLATIAVLAVSATLVAGPAGAASISIPASTGHNAWGGFPTDIFDTDNSYVCADQGNLVSGYWFTPLVLHNFAGGNVTLTQSITNGSTQAASKGYAFTDGGALYSSTGNWSAGTSVGTLSIPAGGTAFLDTFLMHAQGHAVDCLNSVKAAW
jgi:hypothetical protein